MPLPASLSNTTIIPIPRSTRNQQDVLQNPAILRQEGLRKDSAYPPVMVQRQSDDEKTLVNTPDSSSTSTTHDVWHVSHNDSDLRTSINDVFNYEDFTRAAAETEVFARLRFSLKDVAEQLPANGGRAQLYGAHMLFALAILHTKKIVHNDVKLSNFFLSEAGHPLLGDADGGYFHFETKDEKKEHYAEDIRGLGAAIYEMHTGQVLEFDARGEAMLPEVHLPPLLGDLLERIFGKKASPLKTNLAYVRSHPYFANINWRQIAFPNLADATYHHSPLEFPKPEADGPVYADVPEIDCDWEISYGKARPPPPPPSPVEVNIMDLKLDELVGRYAPLKGVRVPKYFESAEGEEVMLGSSFEL
ncbi:hypothetical protein ONZ45_g5337 [Pleurotus djamor]|nr:hypothetical protein ONZ45_g5337 [Pleurotus djamor]